MTWITDKHGNRCSVEKFGTEENARAALATLKDCYNCSDCSDCSDCYNCSDCSDCSDCYNCSDCSRCYNCSDCSDCSAKSNLAPSEGDPLKVPVIPDIHKAVYEAASRPEALEMSTCHACENTHCRAVWVVTLAGKEGKELEARFGTLYAATKIYDASDPNYRINPCRFFDENDAALEDMERLAKA